MTSSVSTSEEEINGDEEQDTGDASDVHEEESGDEKREEGKYSEAEDGGITTRRTESLPSPQRIGRSGKEGTLLAGYGITNADNEPLGFKMIICYAGVVIVVFAAIAISVIPTYLGVHSDSSQYPGSNPNYDYIKVYENGLLNLQKDFENQTDRFWKILRSRGLAHLKKKSPPQPLVLLIVAPPSAHSFVDCFSKKLAKKLDPEHAKQLSIINGKDYTHSPGHVTKEKLDDKLKEALQSGRRAAVIHNLELLPPPSPLLFHSYCDNDNAPYKHVAILFTVHLPGEPNPLLSAVETEGLVENFLSREVWTDGSEYNLDAVSALLSRIADTVVVLSGEDEQKLKSVCDFS